MTIGHNSAAGEQVKSLVDRIERLEAERRELANDIKEIYREAKSAGFDTAALREVVRLRRMDRGKGQEREFLVELYKQALGMLDTPLPEAAISRATP